mmetsp:Transcript_10914/g.26191  ORF Transcript_10914/g.26191 Transcript_10914/m.26191 type:complete len:439 (+) Transcript_10914:143-1459(+)
MQRARTCGIMGNGIQRGLCLLLGVLMSAHAAFCPSWTSSQCPLADNTMTRFETELTENMAGQPQAFFAIRKVLAQNVAKFADRNPNPPSMLSATRAWKKLDNAVSISTVIDANTTSRAAALVENTLDYTMSYFGRKSSPASPKTPDRPLFMHFSGPTGVGKSMTADVIARSMFQSTFNSAQELCGRLSFLMNDFASQKPSDIKRNLAEIRKKVAEQLYHCPRSVLIFDEVQAVPEEVLDGTIDIFDHEGSAPLHFDGSPVVTSSCVVIVISDMGSTKLSPGMDRIAARHAVEQDAQERFTNSRKKALLNNVVPFLPLSVEDLAQVAVMELKQLNGRLAREYRGVWGGTITWQKEVPSWLAERCHDELTCYDDGGRGVETVVTHEVQSVVEDALLEECSQVSASDKVSYNNIHISVDEGAGEVTAAVDTVFDKKEFKEL